MKDREQEKELSVKTPEEAIKDLEPDEALSDEVKGGSGVQFSDISITKNYDKTSP